jgi:hypothetical protein
MNNLAQSQEIIRDQTDQQLQRLQLEERQLALEERKVALELQKEKLRQLRRENDAVE